MSDAVLLAMGCGISFIVVGAVYVYARDGFMQIGRREERALVRSGQRSQAEADGRHAA
jgi:hypothetical protein